MKSGLYTAPGRFGDGARRRDGEAVGRADDEVVEAEPGVDAA